MNENTKTERGVGQFNTIYDIETVLHETLHINSSLYEVFNNITFHFKELNVSFYFDKDNHKDFSYFVNLIKTLRDVRDTKYINDDSITAYAVMPNAVVEIIRYCEQSGDEKILFDIYYSQPRSPKIKRIKCIFNLKSFDFMIGALTECKDKFIFKFGNIHIDDIVNPKSLFDVLPVVVVCNDMLNGYNGVYARTNSFTHLDTLFDYERGGPTALAISYLSDLRDNMKRVIESRDVALDMQIVSRCYDDNYQICMYNYTLDSVCLILHRTDVYKDEIRIIINIDNFKMSYDQLNKFINDYIINKHREKLQS